MQLWIVLLGVLHIVVGDQFWRSPFFRSFEESLFECASYFDISNTTVGRFIQNGFPNEPGVSQLIYCALIDLQAWDTQKGIIGRQLIAVLRDFQFNEENERQIQNCLEDLRVDELKDQVLERAYRSFLCYYSVYGNPGSSNQQYLRYTEDIRKKFMREAILIQNVPIRTLLEFCKDNVVTQPEWPDVSLTYVLRVGFYRREQGYDFERLYAQNGAPELLGNEVKLCQDRILERNCEEPECLTQIFGQCVRPYITTLNIVSIAAKELLLEAGTVCGSDPEPSTTPTLLSLSELLSLMGLPTSPPISTVSETTPALPSIGETQPTKSIATDATEPVTLFPITLAPIVSDPETLFGFQPFTGPPIGLGGI
ncbi:uncharacterized protein LOC129741491 [Uranotaenia lowii]|uniref:uncharacterized protein LOC129741491 n=1 Tax=Uranotaenia lowii TaxID=190385 RepID=UPI00247AF6B0|nr:uncharacterized protein LOC129741491 [Uranotaenia lowii]